MVLEVTRGTKVDLQETTVDAKHDFCERGMGSSRLGLKQSVGRRKSIVATESSR